MATITGQVTWQAFEQLPDGDGWHRELIAGELITLPPTKSGHSKIARAIAKTLLAIEFGGIWKIFTEAGYRLSENPPT